MDKKNNKSDNDWKRNNVLCLWNKSVWEWEYIFVSQLGNPEEYEINKDIV